MKMNVQREFVLTVVLLALRISESNAGCWWNPAIWAPCVLQCSDESPTSVTEIIETKLSETGKVDCRASGLSLMLQWLHYPNGVIESNWFNINAKVIELKVYLTDVNDVSVDAFNSSALRTVKSIMFHDFAINTMQNGMFNGLDELEIIEIYSADVEAIQDGVLDSLKELKVLIFKESSLGNIDKSKSINGLTSSEPLWKLENVTFTYKLTDSINRNTFAGLTNVKFLDLSYCQIEFIGENSFDSISESIEILDLSGNKLTNVPGELFHAMLPKDDLKIHIYGNSWNCTCELQSLKLTIEQYENNFDTFTLIECVTPAKCKSVNIYIATCFDDCEITTSPPNQNEYVSRQCYGSNQSDTVTVSIRRPLGTLLIIENRNGKVNVNIDIENAQNNSVVIWFDGLQNSAGTSDDDINCLSANEITSVQIPDLKEDVLYSFCLMDTTRSTVSPLDCVPFLKGQHESASIWFYESSKTLSITLIAIGFAVNVLLGIAIGFWILKYKPFSTQKSQKANGPQDSIPFENDARDRTFNLTSYINNAKLTTTSSLVYDASKCPTAPILPDRHTKNFNEPVYAVVEEMS